MSHCRASCHSAEVFEVTSPHEWVCLEVFRQFPVYFFVRQLGEVEPAFETFYFQYPKFIFQCLIGTNWIAFNFTLVAFRLVSIVTGSVLVRQGRK